MNLVFGGSSYIGRHLCAHFEDKGELLAGTYCNTPKPGLRVYFDIQNPDLEKLALDLDKLRLDLRQASHAIICSAITNIDECKKNQAKSQRINVDSTKLLIEQLWKRRIKPVFFSSDYVYDGKQGNYTEQHPTNPNTIYGTQKKVIEDFLLASGQDYLITRISKIFGLIPGDNTILTSWKTQLEQDQKLRCAYDQIFSFTYVQDLVNALDLAVQKNLRGLYNVSSPESFSRFDLAEKLKSQRKITTGKIVPCSIREFTFLDSRPMNTSLNPKKLIRETGYKFTSMEECINHLK